MSKEEFNRLTEEEKKIAIFEAEKISEKRDGASRLELFRIDNFYVEVKTSLSGLHKRIIQLVDHQSSYAFRAR